MISGIYSGIGSILIPSKQLKWKVVNCFEDRNEFKKFNPLENYFNTKVYSDFDRFISETKEVDVIISQPKCGMFSTYPSTRERVYTEHPHINNLFKAINHFSPMFFAIENLPKLLTLVPIKDFYEKLNHEYDIFPEYITNCGYGNVQLRRRLWVIGAKKEYKYTFKADEHEPTVTVKDVIEDLLTEESYSKFTNHHKIDQSGHVKFMVNVTSIDGEPFTPSKDFTWGQLKKYKFSRDAGEDKVFMYTNRGGEVWRKGFIKPTHWNRYSTTLAGSDCVPLHPFRFEPLTVRERLRFQGMPDDYHFEGIQLNEDGEMDVRLNVRFYWMTSRCIPTEFIAYMFNDFIHNDQSSYTNKRLYSNRIVDLTKYLGCRKDLLTRSKMNCIHCAIQEKCTRSIIK